MQKRVLFIDTLFLLGVKPGKAELLESKPPQPIAFSSHFTCLICYYEVRERVATFAVTCAAKLRKQRTACKSALIFLYTNRHRDDQAQYSRSMVIKLPFASNSSIEISQFATTALMHIFRSGYHYKKAGVVVMDIVPESERQMSLFENTNPKHKALMLTMDKLNASIGSNKLKLASQDLDRTWKMQQEHLSPRYTTQLSEIICVHV